MYDTDSIITIDMTNEYKKHSQYLASLSVALLFLHEIRDISSNNRHQLLWNNIIEIIIYLIDKGAAIDEVLFFRDLMIDQIGYYIFHCKITSIYS